PAQAAHPALGRAAAAGRPQCLLRASGDAGAAPSAAGGRRAAPAGHPRPHPAAARPGRRLISLLTPVSLAAWCKRSILDPFISHVFEEPLMRHVVVAGRVLTL